MTDINHHPTQQEKADMAWRGWKFSPFLGMWVPIRKRAISKTNHAPQPDKQTESTE